MTHHRVSIRNILCPTDFSEFSARAMRRAVALGRWFQCPVTALHVIPYLSPSVMAPSPFGPGMSPIPTDLLMERREDVEAELHRILTTYAQVGVKVRSQIATGQPWREVETVARELPADLVVMGTHGRSGWDRFLMGSTTEKLIRRLGCPVLTIGPTDVAPPTTLFRRILCALELTAPSQATVDLAFAFAEENLAQVTLLHVIDGDRPEWFPAKPHLATRDDFRRSAREGAIEELYRLGKDAPAFCKTDEVVTTGTAWREIVRVADEIQADLIVVGAQGPGGIGESFLGSTAAQTLRHAPCPVMLARPMRVVETAAKPARVA
jgi:nucleotide-binding universal stress UspA family protein